MNLPSFLASSKDPAKLGLTVRGFLISIVPLIMLVTGLAETEVNSAIDAVVLITVAGASVVGAVQMLFGLARKAYLGRWSAKK